MRIHELTPGIGINQDLNPKIWRQGRILEPIKIVLLDIARHFKDYIDLDFPVLDVVITGGQVGKYYTEHSDLDLHLITDFDQIQCDQEMEELFRTKRDLYRQNYDLSVAGIPVELYVEDQRSPGSGGAYSLLNDRWIRPSPEPDKDFDLAEIDRRAESIKRHILTVMKSRNLDQLEKIKDQIWAYRKKGLVKDGEFSTPNLVFKSLRNDGILDRLRSKIRKIQAQNLSK